jgi:hypothetical protein
MRSVDGSGDGRLQGSVGRGVESVEWADEGDLVSSSFRKTSEKDVMVRSRSPKTSENSNSSSKSDERAGTQAGARCGVAGHSLRLALEAELKDENLEQGSMAAALSSTRFAVERVRAVLRELLLDNSMTLTSSSSSSS